MLGPAVAVIWGWVPAMLWVVFGAVLVGCVHDFSALVVSMRAKGMSIGKVAEGVIGPRAKVLFLADLTFATGSNLSSLADRGMEAVMPVEQPKLPDENPADRADETQPVAEEDWPRLPRRVQTKKLDRAAFVDDQEKDCCHCLFGRELAFEPMKMQARDTGEASASMVTSSGHSSNLGTIFTTSVPSRSARWMPFLPSLQYICCASACVPRAVRKYIPAMVAR